VMSWRSPFLFSFTSQVAGKNTATVMLSRFAPLRIALSETKGLTVNFAKHLVRLCNHQASIPRCAQRNDRLPVFFSNLLNHVAAALTLS
jgi:hypothetical protein